MQRKEKFKLLLILFSMVFCIIAFAVIIGPIFFTLVGYEITEKSSITASDSIGYVLESILAAVFAGFTFLKIKN